MRTSSKLRTIIEGVGWFLFCVGNGSLMAIVLALVVCYKFVPQAGIAWGVVPTYLLIGSPGLTLVGLVIALGARRKIDEN
jgi:hypothetical protein